MARWFGYTIHALQRMQSGSCSTDLRVIWRNGEPLNLALVESRERSDSISPINSITYIPPLCGQRELRLLALQLMAVADSMDELETEVVLP
jgi:hypothetical protein